MNSRRHANLVAGAPWEILHRLGGHSIPRLGQPLNWLFQRTRPRTISTYLAKNVHVTLDLDDHTANNIYYLGDRYEYPTLQILKDWILNGACQFFDIGSNFGYFSLVLAAHHPNLHAFAFEPHPKAFAQLSNNISQNLPDQIESFPIALSDKPGEVRFICDPENSGASYVIEASQPQPEGDIITVRAETFDSLAKDRAWMKLPSIAKIDAEGHEELILAGMSSSLERGQFVGICLELNSEVLHRTGKDPQTIISYLGAHGYRHISHVYLKSIYGRCQTENHFFKRARN